MKEKFAQDKTDRSWSKDGASGSHDGAFSVPAHGSLPPAGVAKASNVTHNEHATFHTMRAPHPLRRSLK
jgi:hypothetical protein